MNILFRGIFKIVSYKFLNSFVLITSVITLGGCNLGVVGKSVRSLSSLRDNGYLSLPNNTYPLATATSTVLTVVPAGGLTYAGLNLNLGSQFLAESICSGKTIFGRAGNQLCSGVNATNRGTWNMTTSFPGSGFYTGVSNPLTPAQVCTGGSFLGTSNAAICQTGSTVVPAGVGEVLASQDIWNGLGTKLTGTMSNRGTWDVTTSFPGSGYFSAVSNSPTATQICTGFSYLGVTGSGVCQSGTISGMQTAAQTWGILSSQQGWNGSGTQMTGTMVNQGAWNLTGVFPGSGYYSSVTNTPAATQICSASAFVLGVAGSAVCQTGTLSSAASVTDVLSGRQYWDATGALNTGTMTNQGSINLNTTALPSPSSGYYSSVTTTLAASNVCSGNQLLGTAGTATCFPALNTILQPQSISMAVSNSNCAIVNGGGLCWGTNGSGQLGSGNTLNYSTPIQIIGFTQGVQSLTTTASTGCGIMNGAAYCWGTSASGQLGNNGATTSSLTPIQVFGLSQGVQALASANPVNCALVNGGVQCWGIGNSGVLGNGAAANSSTPSTVVGLTQGVQSIFGGNANICAIAQGAAWCWGLNSDGRLGNGTTTNVFTPILVAGLTQGVQSISVSTGSFCAIVNGGVQCWGGNSTGQLGNGTTTNSTVPVQVVGLTQGVQAISAGSGFHCALVNGSVQCWGQNNVGQLGNGTQVASSTPIQVLGLSQNVQSITSGQAHNCALSNGMMQCWGSNPSGQLGNGSTATFVLTPVYVKTGQ